MASARDAPAHFAEHPAELLGQGAGHRSDRPVERLLEAETGLDADDQQVQHVGQGDPDRHLPLLDLAVEGSRPGPSTRSTETSRNPPIFSILGGCRTKKNRMNITGMSDAHDADGEELVDALRAGDPEGGVLAFHLVDVPHRGEPAAEPGEAGQDGRHCSLADRLEQPLAADVLDLVALELAQRGLHGGLLLRLTEHSPDREADRGRDEDESDAEHVLLRSRS